MRKPLLLSLTIVLLAGASGCTDTWAGYAREERNLKNELADYMLQIVDEESAQRIVDGDTAPAKKLKDKWEDHKDRFEKFLKAQTLGQLKQALQQMETLQAGGEYKMGIGKSELTFTKGIGDTFTVKGTMDDSTKDAVETITDPDFIKAMRSANQRLEDQANRIRRIVPQGPNLQKAAGLSKGTFQ
jgi:hypothetical protein